MNYDDTLAFLKLRGMSYKIHEHPAVYTMEAVIDLVDLPLENAVKSLVFSTKNGEQIFVAAIPGLKKIDYRLLAEIACVRRRDIKSMDPDDVLSLLGDIPGAVGPFQKQGIDVFVDTELAAFDRVHCGSGRPDRTIEISGESLATLATTVGKLCSE